MIVQLRNKEIFIKSPYTPEDITHTKISYIFELNTNQFRPVLYLEDTVYEGSNVYVDFSKCVDSDVHLKVELVDNVNRVMCTYKGVFKIYRTFSLGTEEQINVYNELIEAQARIKELEEQGEVI